jgi:hypothetical protein
MNRGIADWLKPRSELVVTVFKLARAPMAHEVTISRRLGARLTGRNWRAGYRVILRVEPAGGAGEGEPDPPGAEPAGSTPRMRAARR